MPLQLYLNVQTLCKGATVNVLVLQDVPCCSYECKDHFKQGCFHWWISVFKECGFVFGFMHCSFKRKKSFYIFYLNRPPSHFITMPSVTMRTLSESLSHLGLRGGFVMATRGQTRLAPFHSALDREPVSGAGLLSWRCIWFCFG